MQSGDRPPEGTGDRSASLFPEVLIFLILGCILRFLLLDRQSLWNDEFFSIDVASKPFTQIPAWLAAHYHHPPLYFQLTHTVFEIWGATAWSLRFLPALSGAMTVALVVFVSGRLFGRSGGILAGLLCLVAPFHLAYSQEGRPYALAGLLAVISCASYYYSLRDTAKRWIIAYIVSTLALLYTHHWGIFVFAAQAAIPVFKIISIRLPWKHLIPVFVFVGICYLPEFIIMRHQDTSTPAGVWFWVRRPELLTVVYMMEAYSGTYFGMATSVFSLPAILRIGGAAAVFALLCIGIGGAIRGKSEAVRYYLFLSLIIPGIPFVIALFKPEVFLWYRYTVIPMPIWFIAASGIVTTQKALVPLKPGIDAPVCQTLSSILPAVLTGILLLCGTIGTVYYFGWEKSNVCSAIGYADSVTNRYDIPIIIRPRYLTPHFNYYYHGIAKEYDEAYLNTPLGDIIDTASSFTYLSLDVPNDIRDYFDSHFQRIAMRQFPGEAHMGLIVGVYKRQSPP